VHSQVPLPHVGFIELLEFIKALERDITVDDIEAALRLLIDLRLELVK
jgi:hypothetical protein